MSGRGSFPPKELLGVFFPPKSAPLPAKRLAWTMTYERLSADGATHGVPVLYAAELV